MTPRSGARPFSILNGCRHMLAIAPQRAKGRDDGKEQFVARATTKASFEMESELPEELSTTFRRATHLPSPVRVLEQRGIVTCRNAPCLKLGVRKRKRSFSLGGVCDPVFYFPS